MTMQPVQRERQAVGIGTVIEWTNERPPGDTRMPITRKRGIVRSVHEGYILVTDQDGYSVRVTGSWRTVTAEELLRR